MVTTISTFISINTRSYYDWKIIKTYWQCNCSSINMTIIKSPLFKSYNGGLGPSVPLALPHCLFTYCNIIYWNCTIIGINLNLFCIPITSSRWVSIYCSPTIIFAVCNHLITYIRKSNREIIQWEADTNSDYDISPSLTKTFTFPTTFSKNCFVVLPVLYGNWGPCVVWVHSTMLNNCTVKFEEWASNIQTIHLGYIAIGN